jgi:CTP:molybdopterin cytidylyltransferase MocA
MGRPKQIEVVDGEPMVVRAVKLAQASGATYRLLVTGAYDDQVRDTLTRWRIDWRTLEEAGAAGFDDGWPAVVVLHNPQWRAGQASSVHAALAALPAAIGAALFLPVDQPFVPAELLQALIAAWQRGAGMAAPTVANEVRGAPAIFDRSLWLALLTLEGDVGGRKVLQQYLEDVATVAADGAWLRDIDTPADVPSA